MIEGKLKVGELVYSAEDLIDFATVGDNINDITQEYIYIGDGRVVASIESAHENLSKSGMIYAVEIGERHCRTREQAVALEIEVNNKMVAEVIERSKIAENILRRQRA